MMIYINPWAWYLEHSKCSISDSCCCCYLRKIEPPVTRAWCFLYWEVISLRKYPIHSASCLEINKYAVLLCIQYWQQDLFKKEKGLKWNVLFFFYEGIEETDVERGLVVISFAMTLFFSFDIIYGSHYKLFLPSFLGCLLKNSWKIWNTIMEEVFFTVLGISGTSSVASHVCLPL